MIGANTFEAYRDFAALCEEEQFTEIGDLCEHADRMADAGDDLLAACRLLMKAEAMQQGERGGYIMGAISSAIDAARAAIAKAEGAR